MIRSLLLLQWIQALHGYLTFFVTGDHCHEQTIHYPLNRFPEPLWQHYMWRSNNDKHIWHTFEKTTVYMASRGVLGHTESGGSPGCGWWGIKEGRDKRGFTQGRGGEGSSLPVGNIEVGTQRWMGGGSPCQSLYCVHLPTTLPFSLSLSPPPLLCLRQPLESVWLIKERGGGGGSRE